MCWQLCVALTLGVGYVAVDTPWHGVPGARLVTREPCSHRSGPYVETTAGLPADGTWIGDKPGRETCVVSQVMADTLAGLPLEGCRVHVV